MRSIFAKINLIYMKEQVIGLLNAIGQMPQDLIDHLFTILEDGRFAKDEMFHKEGEVCDQILFLRKGMIVGQKMFRGKEVTTWIMRNGDYITSPQSFFMQMKSKEWMIAVEPCEYFAITFRQLEDIYQRWPLFYRHGKTLTEQYYMKSLDREDFLKNHRGIQKYKMLVETDPELVRRCPQKYLASYINVSVTTLSTLRGKFLGGK
jgi:hypothetical protein